MNSSQSNSAGSRCCGREWPDGGLKVLHLLMGLDIGGVERLLADALPLFPDSYRVGVLALGADGPMGDLLRERDISVKALCGSKSRPQVLLQLLQQLRKEKPHVLHTHLYWPGLLGRVIGKFAGAEIVVCHEHYPADEISAWRRRLERPTWKYADAVVGVSKAVIDSRNHELPLTVGRFVVPNAIKIEDFDDGARDEARRIMGLNADDFAAGWVGRVDENVKDITTLLRAAKMLRAKHPQIRWVLIGDGPDRKVLERLTHTMGLDDITTWMGMRPDARRLYRGMDVFLLPSKHEGFGIVLIEAMAAGVPIVATRVGGIPEVVTDGENGLLVATGNPDALAGSISCLLGDKKLRMSMGENGRRRAVEKFDIKIFVDNMDRLYRSLWSGNERKCAE